MHLPQSGRMHNSFDSAAAELRDFLASGDFAVSGAVMTDLDGTAVLERDGLVYLPPEVENGLKRIHAHGRPVIANTLRFPLSVMRVFGDEWHRATGTDLPLVSMKGAQIGRVHRGADGLATFEEWHSETLDRAGIDAVLDDVDALVSDGVTDLLVFHYARDWRLGERIWTPDSSRTDRVRDKYRSASDVASTPVAALRTALHAEPICMIFLLVDRPGDHLMAYQHTQRSSFHTHSGVSKRSGAERMAAHLGVDLAASIGAGDAPPDDFLAATGFSIIVGGGELDYRGLAHTVRVDTIADFGRLLDLVERRLP